MHSCKQTTKIREDTYRVKFLKHILYSQESKDPLNKIEAMLFVNSCVYIYCQKKTSLGFSKQWNIYVLSKEKLFHLTLTPILKQKKRKKNAPFRADQTRSHESTLVLLSLHEDHNSPKNRVLGESEYVIEMVLYSRGKEVIKEEFISRFYHYSTKNGSDGR